VADEVADSAALRRFATGFGGAVVGVAVALWAYFQFVAPGAVRHADEVAASLDAPAPVAMAPAEPAPAPAIATAPDAVPPAPDAAPPGNDAFASIGQGAAQVAESLSALAGGRERAARDALNRAAGYRVAISEVYVSNGTWPETAAATGMPPVDPATSGAVQSIDVGPGGVITVRLREPFAAGSRFVLTPTAGSDHSIQWACRSEGDPALRAAVPECS